MDKLQTAQLQKYVDDLKNVFIEMQIRLGKRQSRIIGRIILKLNRIIKLLDEI